MYSPKTITITKQPNLKNPADEDKQAVEKPPPHPPEALRPTDSVLTAARHKSQLEAECFKVLKTIAGRLELTLAEAYSNVCLSGTRWDLLCWIVSGFICTDALFTPHRE